MEIPDIEDGMFNVAVAMLSVHDDGGWSQAQYDGLTYLEENMENVHTAYVENVAEGADSEQVFRALSRKGFDLIIGGSFGYMDSMEVVAEEFPDIAYVHISGYKANEVNFGNLMGAMEDMKYLAGMLAGSRCVADGATKTGYMATFPIPEETRLGNAFALGLQQTCPECTMDVRWINTWHDPIIEREAADSLFDAGAHVVFTGADTPAPALAAADREGVYGITYDWSGSCTDPACLTAPYWNWGPVFLQIAEEVQAGTYVFGWHYFDADTGGLGLSGFMDGQEPQPGIADLPEEDVQMVRDTLALMLAGEFDRFDVFSGPIVDNAGNTIVPEGEKMEQLDMDQFPSYGGGCTYCMYWWNQNITAELPEE
ncbi:MAG: BMP family ABC transporter substrate-binding protein [Anaerolineales bacterium]|nr:BMP family ABC transporter substrate-binding protein [Anaerolineales bacterium]